MAIIEELGIEVNILSGGEAAKEYPNAKPIPDCIKVGPDTQITHCYIEVGEHMEFSIQARIIPGDNPAAKWVKPKTHAFSILPSFDGGPYRGGMLLCKAGKSYCDDGTVDFMKATVQNYRFAALSVGKWISPKLTCHSINKLSVESSDALRIERDKEMARNLGLIYIGVFRDVMKRRKTKPPAQRAYSEFDKEKLSLTEAALKGQAVSLGTTLSPVIDISKSEPWDLMDSDQVEPLDRPFAVFSFKYRTREDLQKLGIIPRPRNPSLEPVIGEGLPGGAVKSHPRTPSPHSMDHTVRSLPHENLIQLAAERLKALPLEEVLRLFGEELEDLNFGQISRLASERLEDLPFRVIRRLAGEGLQKTEDKDERPATIKAEDQERPHLQQSSQQPARIKRERVEVPISSRPAKHRLIGGRKQPIDLTEDD